MVISSNMTQDTVSVHSDNTSTDELHLRDDSTSMRPLFGSLVSDTGNLAVSYSTGIVTVHLYVVVVLSRYTCM